MSTVALAFNALCAVACLAWAVRAFARGRDYPARFMWKPVAARPAAFGAAFVALAFSMTAVACSGRTGWGENAVFVVIPGLLFFAYARARPDGARR